MSNKVEGAVQKFTVGYNCAQSVVYAYSEDVDLDQDTALKLACGFGGGLGQKGEVCGALTGGVLVISARHGRGEKDDKPVTLQTYAKVRELMDRFQAQFGAVSCRELLQCDPSTPEGQQYARENDLTNKICKNCVISVAQILEDLL